MASVTDICNRALQKLGATRINSLNDATPSARACSATYTVVRDAVLRDHPWNFAIQRFQLAATTPPIFGKKSAVTLPTGWLRVLPPDPKQNLNDRDWIIEGNTLLTDEDVPLNVRVLMKVEDTTLMDPTFQEALASKLAFELCEILTQSNAKKQACDSDYEKSIGRAKKCNAIEKVPEVAAEDHYITARI